MPLYFSHQEFAEAMNSRECTYSLKAKEFDPTVSIHRGINWDWANFESEQAADDFYQYMTHNYSGVVRFGYSKHNNLYEVRWG